MANHADTTNNEGNTLPNQCAALTKKGTRCKNGGHPVEVTSGRVHNLCGQHDDKFQDNHGLKVAANSTLDVEIIHTESNNSPAIPVEEDNKESINMPTTNTEEPLFACAHCRTGKKDHTKAEVVACSTRKEMGLVSIKFANLLVTMATERPVKVGEDALDKALTLTTEKGVEVFDKLKATPRTKTTVVHNDDAMVNCGECSHWVDTDTQLAEETGKLRHYVEVKDTLAHVREHSATANAERAAAKDEAKARIESAKS